MKLYLFSADGNRLAASAARKRMGTERLRRRNLRELEKLLKAAADGYHGEKQPEKSGVLFENLPSFLSISYISGISLNFEKVIIYKRPNQHIYDKFI